MQNYLLKVGRRRNVQWNSSTNGRTTTAGLSTLVSVVINPYCITGTSSMDDTVTTMPSLLKTLFVETGGWVLILQRDKLFSIVNSLEEADGNGVLMMDDSMLAAISLSESLTLGWVLMQEVEFPSSGTKYGMDGTTNTEYRRIGNGDSRTNLLCLALCNGRDTEVTNPANHTESRYPFQTNIGGLVLPQIVKYFLKFLLNHRH